MSNFSKYTKKWICTIVEHATDATHLDRSGASLATITVSRSDIHPARGRVLAVTGHSYVAVLAPLRSPGIPATMTNESQLAIESPASALLTPVPEEPNQLSEMQRKVTGMRHNRDYRHASQRRI